MKERLKLQPYSQKLVNTTQAAKMANRSTEWIRGQRKLGNIEPKVIYGREVMYREQDVVRLIQSKRVNWTEHVLANI